MFSFLSSCSNSSQNTRQQVPVFNYPSYPALGITKSNSCTETVSPYFRQLGIECICNNYNSGYSYKSNERGVATRCTPPSEWLAQKRQEEATQNRLAREEQQRKLAAEREWERTRPQREAQARQQAEQERLRLNSICPIYYAARQSCANAANYGQCMNIRMSNRYNQYDDSTCFRR